MQDSVALAQFSDYLKNERKSSDNTISSYMRDMRQLSEYLDEHNMPNLLDAGEKELGLYVDWLRHIGKSPATISRCIATFKCFYKHFFAIGLIVQNPAASLISEKLE